MGFSLRGPCAFGGFGDQRRPRAVRRPCGAASADPGPPSFKTIAETSLGGLVPVVIVGAVTTVVTVAVLGEKVASVGSKVGELETATGAKFDALSKKVGELETTAGAKFDALDTKVGKLETKFNALDTKFDALDTKVGKVETKADIKFEVLGSMEARLDAKVDKLEIKMDAKVDKLESRLDANFDKLATKLDALMAQGLPPRRR